MTISPQTDWRVKDLIRKAIVDCVRANGDLAVIDEPAAAIERLIYTEAIKRAMVTAGDFIEGRQITNAEIIHSLGREINFGAL